MIIVIIPYRTKFRRKKFSADKILGTKSKFQQFCPTKILSDKVCYVFTWEHLKEFQKKVYIAEIGVSFFF